MLRQAVKAEESANAARAQAEAEARVRRRAEESVEELERHAADMRAKAVDATNASDAANRAKKDADELLAEQELEPDPDCEVQFKPCLIESYLHSLRVHASSPPTISSRMVQN